jgi:hypothetical protein
MNPQDLKGHGVKPRLIGKGYSKDKGSTGLLARQRRPAGAEEMGVLLAKGQQASRAGVRYLPRAMLAMTCRHCNLTTSSSLRGLEAKLWSCDFPSCRAMFLLNVNRMMGSRTPDVTTSSFCGGWPTISFFSALKTSICSPVFLEFRICTTQGSRAIFREDVDAG